ncbi:hypothetical protein [Micromonospora sp. NPDC093277]|uniref:hypothetical protein n=1 Tax=Micromonospora sp. NPDC093277 TaxID=3364291 RepID=UPI00380A1DA1
MTNRVRAWVRGRPLAADASVAAALVLLDAAFLLLTPQELRPAQLWSALGWAGPCCAPPRRRCAGSRRGRRWGQRWPPSPCRCCSGRRPPRRG